MCLESGGHVSYNRIQNLPEAGISYKGGDIMKCPKCGSTNVNVQMVTETQLKTKHKGLLWWLCIGWLWVPIKWFFFTIPALIVKIFAPKKYKLKTMHSSMCVCQNCGYHWNA